MRTLLDYLLIIVIALLQVSFFQFNLLLLILLIFFLRKGYSFAFPRIIFAAAVLAFLSGSPVGILIFSFLAIFALFGFAKQKLPQALFVKAALLILALPSQELLYQTLIQFWSRL